MGKTWPDVTKLPTSSTLPCLSEPEALPSGLEAPRAGSGAGGHTTVPAKDGEPDAEKPDPRGGSAFTTH